ncbi:hypothetical protein HK096_006211 [Nowakowskiella sp. JEL0078]|nr:hypothetical protein HK096_006211 [Nowakowskiella sp. JEL0078]
MDPFLSSLFPSVPLEPLQFPFFETPADSLHVFSNTDFSTSSIASNDKIFGLFSNLNPNEPCNHEFSTLTTPQLTATSNSSDVVLDRFLEQLLCSSPANSNELPFSYPSPQSEISTNSSLSNLPNFNLEESAFSTNNDFNEVYMSILNSLVNGGFPSNVPSSNNCCGSEHSFGFCNTYGEFDFTLFPEQEDSSFMSLASEFPLSPASSLTQCSDSNEINTPMAAEIQSKKKKNLKGNGNKNEIDFYSIEPKQNGKYECPAKGCGALHSRRFNLRVHYQASHCGLKPFKCDNCDRSFTRKWDLRRHCKVFHKSKTEDV